MLVRSAHISPRNLPTGRQAPTMAERKPVRKLLPEPVTWNDHTASDIPDNNYHKHTKNTKMKKITIILALVLTVSATFAFTGPEKVNSQALNTFNSEFVGATDATWTISKNFDKVTFSLSGQVLSAYYNKAGEFMAVTQYISSLELPRYLQRSIKKSYSNYWISDLFEVASREGTEYYVTFENADTKIVLKSIDGSSWSIYQKSKKA